MATPTDNKERLANAEQRRAVDVEKVIKAALGAAADHFAQREDDPGWGAEMNEEMLYEAIVEAAASVTQAKIAREVCEGKREAKEATPISVLLAALDNGLIVFKTNGNEVVAGHALNSDLGKDALAHMVATDKVWGAKDLVKVRDSA